MDSDYNNPASADTNSLDEDEGPKTRELSKYEKDQLEIAKKKLKDGIVKTQVVMGKEFKGTSFIAKPDKIIFKDFDLGEVHQQTIQMTNVSYTFNSFKILELKESIRDFFTIIYKPSGRIGAGIACPITIKFIPQLNQDIFDHLPLLSETGPINVPIECTCKKAIVTIEDSITDFKKVILGESGTKTIKLTNNGALETEIVMKNQRGVNLGQKYDNTSSRASSILGRSRSTKSLANMANENEFEEEDKQEEKIISQLTFDKTLKIKGYSNLSIPIVYKPIETGPFEYGMVIYFENYMHSPPINITLQGECIEVPIYVEKTLYNFEICLLNHIYREKILFFNRSNTAMKVQMEVPKESKRFFEFNPSLGYIQGNSKFEIWVKFNAEPEVLTICAKYIENNVLIIPFKLIGSDQVMPVEFEIKAKISVDKLQFIPQTLNFGRLYEKTSSCRQLKIENFSDLPQEIIFFPIPKNIRIFPDLIPLKILPKESLNVDFTYLGNEIVTEDTHIRCKIITGTISNRDGKVNYKAEVVRCAVSFSTMKIDFQAIQISEKYQAFLTIRNNTKVTQMIEFFLPYYEICGLKITPLVTSIPPEKSTEVIIEYESFFKKLGAFTLGELKTKYEQDPNRNFELRLKLKQEEERKALEEQRLKEEEEKLIKAGGKVAKKGTEKKETPKEADRKALSGSQDGRKAVKLTKQQEKELEEELKKQQELEKLKEEEEKQKRLEIEKNFDAKRELEKLGGKFIEFDKPGQPAYSQHYDWLIPCYFAYNRDGVIGDPNVVYLQVNTVSVTKNLVTSKEMIEFGEIAVGFRKVEELLITNSSEQEAKLHMDLLPTFGGFSVIGALRTIAPGKTKSILIQFEPHEEQIFEETLRLYTDTSMVSCKLRGSGVRPEVKLSKEDGLFPLGGCVLGERTESNFKILNLSNFQLKFKLLSRARGITNKNGSEVFAYIPSEGSIPAKKDIEIKLIFNPDRISEKFFDIITVDVPNQVKEKSLYIIGSCFPRQSYISPHIYLYKPLTFPNLEEFQGKKLESPLDTLSIKDEETVFGCGNNKIILEFAKQKDKNDKNELCFSRKIIIGSAKLLDPKLEKPTNFEITMPKEEKGDKQSYFSCDNTKGTVAPGTQVLVSVNFKPPATDPFIAHIEALAGIGQWIEQKGEAKLSGGFVRAGYSDQVVVEIIFRAYINQV